jgi:hypothetical protein
MTSCSKAAPESSCDRAKARQCRWLGCGRAVDILCGKNDNWKQHCTSVHAALASQPDSVDIRVNHSPASAANVAGMVRALPIG